jgi:hypothetical protein
LKNYAITFNNNGGSGSMSNQTVQHGVAQTISTNTFTRTNYIFDGWNTAADGTGTSYPAGDSITLNGSTTLWAKWTVVGYDVIFVEQGGTNVPDNRYNQDVRTVVLPSTTLAGYTFRGWYTTSTGGVRIGGAGSSYTINGTGAVTYYAQWSVNTYFVSFNNNSSTSGSVPALQSGNFATSITIRGNTGNLARTGYTFGGWNTQANGLGTTYAAGSASYTFPAQNVTQYAYWIANPVTITFMANGGTGSMSVQNSVSGVTALNTNTFVAPAGKVFQGWTTTSNGATSGAGFYAPGSNITLTGNITLYARWL